LYDQDYPLVYNTVIAVKHDIKNYFMNTRRKVTALATTLLTFGLLGGINASVLTFDISGISNFQNVNQTYGDNITATTIGGFSYGAAEGFTPNVTVTYGDTDPALWTTGYGNLTNVLFEDADATGILTITFDADPGYEVRLHSFDLASFSGDRIVDLVDVNSASSSLFSENNSLISGTTSTLYNFVSPLQADDIIISIDARNLGSNNDDIGIDNIVFSQVAVPEPSSALLIGLGCLGLIIHRRKIA